LAILVSDPADPWQFVVDGIIEFKKHSSMSDDAELIDFMKNESHEKRITHGVLVLLVVGSSENDVINKEVRLTRDLISDVPVRWRKLGRVHRPTNSSPLGSEKVGDPWWTICCLVSA
jgi:hypothetical protein